MARSLSQHCAHLSGRLDDFSRAPKDTRASASMDSQRRDEGRLRQSERLARKRQKNGANAGSAEPTEPVAWSWFPGPAAGGGAGPSREPDLLDQLLAQDSP